MQENLLEEVGLTRIEAKVYIILLELGSALAGKITEKSGIHRRSVYDALERLLEKGLVSYVTTNNRRYFEAVEPKRLLQIIEERKDNLKSILPELELKRKYAEEKQETTFFKGKQALKTLFDSQIATRKEILIFGAATNAYKIIKYYFSRYDTLRVKYKIPVKAIFNTKLERIIPLSKIRYLPRQYSSHAATNIYGDNVAIILWSEEPLAILIKNKEIAAGYRQYFKLMWKVAKKKYG
jgi:sugar-specific transcriptional regulator TrmB